LSSNIAEPLRKLAIAIEELHPDPANARKHNQKNLDAIKASLHAYGQRKPIVVQRQGMIVRAGNGTLDAAKALGWTHLAAVVIDEDNATASQFAIADNRTGELAEWDTETLATLLDGMDDETRDLLAFDEKDMQAMLDGLQPEQIETTEDEPPPLPEKPTTKAGDIITMGDHRLMCGDCRKPEDMAALMMGATINVAFTSPPYASQRKYDESSGFKPIHPDEFVEWFDAVQSGVRGCLAGDGSWFVNIKEHCEDGQRSLYVKDLTIAHVRQWGWAFIDEFAWTKSGVPGKWPNRFKNAWEPVFHFAATSTVKLLHDNVSYASKDLIDYHPDNKKTHSGFISSGGGDNGRRDGMALPSNVLEIHNSAKQTDTGAVKHDATFPVALPSFFIKAYSDEGDSIFDPFMGSGTTLIAAEQLGRKCYGMEISPAYCDVIVKRWENLTGKQATRG
jgi:DNA modification methylase